MDVAIHARATTEIEASRVRFARLEVVKSYGLRPDLFAVANILSGEGLRGRVAYAKGALEAIAELCRLPADRLARIRTAGRRAGAGGHSRARRCQDLRARSRAEHSLPESLRDLRFELVGLIGFADPCVRTCPPPWPNADPRASVWS
jgi:Ca2+-transporting ATPase